MAVNIQGFESKENVEDKPESLMTKLNKFFVQYSSVPLKEKLFFLKHLSVMLKAGISLSAALKTLSTQSSNPKFSMVLKDVYSSVEKGVSFTESLRKHEKVFGELFINMVEAGEISGKLENVLNQLHLQTKKSYELISKVKGALTYPAVVMFAMCGIGAFMMFYIVPKITSMFSELNVQLPLPTRILMGVSGAVTNHAFVSIIFLIGFIIALTLILRTSKGKYVAHTLLIKLPIIADIVKKINIAQFARTISSLLKTDIMIIKTFQITSRVQSNMHYRIALTEISEKIKHGGKIYECINKYPTLFPPIVAQMVAIGEETGELDNILEELAEFYESEIDQIMENLPSIIEPLLILFLGGGIGGIAVAILLPMFSLNNAI